MKVTVEWLKEQKACKPGVDRFILKHKQSAELETVINGHIEDNTLDWANWLIVRKMTHKQQIRYAIFAAEQVLSLYEGKYPDDKRPRQAIEAAKAVLKKNNVKTREAARAAWAAVEEATAWAAEAAARAALTAAEAAVEAAALTAARAAWAAVEATAEAAARAAARAAAEAAADEAAEAAARAAMIIKILEYGLKLIYKESK